MYSLIAYIIIQSQVQTVQIDDFSSKTKCEESIVLMTPLFMDMYARSNAQISTFCIQKND